MTFSIYSCQRKGVTYLDEYIETIEKQLPILKEAWENLDPYTINNHWRKNLDRNLELIGTGHYTVLKSLNYVRKNKDQVKMNDPEQKFKNIYFHFGLIIDCIRQISRSILLFKNKLGLLEFSEEKLQVEAVTAQVINWYKDNYNSSFKKLESLGVSILIPLQPKKEYLSILTSKENFKKYNTFKSNILQYRNIHIHNPTIDIFRRQGEIGEFVVKKDIFKNYRFLGEIDRIDADCFIDPKIMTNDDYSECLEVIHEIWTIFLKHIKEINSHPDFQKKSKKNYA